MNNRTKKPAAGRARNSESQYPMSRAAHIDVQSARKGTTVIRISTMLRPRLGVRYRARFCAKARAFITVEILNVRFPSRSDYNSLLWLIVLTPTRKASDCLAFPSH